MRTLLLITLALLSGHASGQHADDAALLLADGVAPTTTKTRAWRAQVEAGIVHADRPFSRSHHLSFDMQLDTTVAPSLRVALANRLDLSRDSRTAELETVNTLKEAYASYAYSKDRIIDIGRINVRSGAALGYNPTDFFRTKSLRAINSIDPESLRSNRLGSVMLRGQAISHRGSLTLLYSPKLANAPDSSAFDIDLGATNSVDRYLLLLSPQLAGASSSTMLLYGEQGQAPTLGLNQTWVAGRSTVVYLEVASGKSVALLDRALGRHDDASVRTKLAAGLRFTTQQKQTVSLEYDYSGVSLNRKQWDALREGAPGDYLRYRQWVQAAQELPTRQAWFVHANWQDAGADHLDVSFMARRDIADRSSLYWLEGRYHFRQSDLIVQAQHNAGDARSTFGALPHANIWTVKLLTFF